MGKISQSEASGAVFQLEEESSLRALRLALAPPPHCKVKAKRCVDPNSTACWLMA
jgi:hypothetical protein